jgi:tRNA(fMet)-specific endonuclease VapC
VRKSGAVIGTCPPIIGELFYGIELSQSRDSNFATAQITLKSLKIWPYDRDAAEEYGIIAAELKRKGRPMQIPDMQLAAVAFLLGSCTVVTTDSDLSAIPGLSVEDWTQPEEP